MISDRMKERGITQQELSERSGISVSTLTRIRGGGEQRRRNAATLAAISKALGWSEEYLRNLDSPREAPPGPGVEDRLSALEREVGRIAEIVDRGHQG